MTMTTSNNAFLIATVLGWIFLAVGAAFPTGTPNKRVIKVAFSALSLGVFLATFLFQFVK